jgi:hypothetical protein
MKKAVQLVHRNKILIRSATSIVVSVATTTTTAAEAAAVATAATLAHHLDAEGAEKRRFERCQKRHKSTTS